MGVAKVTVCDLLLILSAIRGLALSHGVCSIVLQVYRIDDLEATIAP